jgi:hypothetical protein
MFRSLSGRACRGALCTAVRSKTTHCVSTVALLLGVMACADGVVPSFANPTAVPTSTSGVQNAVTGVFSASRDDQQGYLMIMAGFARDAFVFLTSDVQFITGPGGLEADPLDITSLLDVWNNEFTAALEVNATIATLPTISTYTSAQVAAITGVLQTMKALNFMYLAETHDTLGIPLYAIGNGPTSPYCNKDVWAYIVALLDSGNADLNTAGPLPLPVALPSGFASVGNTAAPSTTPGAFAAFNRALAGKAGLELAYAIARSSPATAPTPTTPGLPNAAALTRADSAMLASALYSPAAIMPPPGGGYSPDAYGVYHSFSAQSGDLPNPLNVYATAVAALYDLQYDVDTLHDQRWLNKFSVNPIALQGTNENGTASRYLYSAFLNVASPVPIVRDEELTLVRAQIRLGLGDFAGAIALINTVHQQAGGFATPLTITPSYTAVRDTLMKEQRISTALEGSGDRAITIRMYGMETISDTTWQATAGPDAVAVANLTKANGAPPVDYHTTIEPIPPAELTGRNGNYTLTCP